MTDPKQPSADAVKLAGICRIDSSTHNIALEIQKAFDARDKAMLERCAVIAHKWMTPEQIRFGKGGAGAEIRALLPEADHD